MQPYPDISRSHIARYLQLAMLFRNRIASGEWGVGERIPNVEDLAEKFQVARGTIREAMSVLAEEGLIERYRAKGSFVSKALPTQGVHHLESDWNSMIEFHKGVDIRVLEQERVTTLPAYASALGIAAPEYEMMRRLHLRDKQAYLLGRFYLDRELFLLGPPERFLHEPTLPILHDVAGERIAAARQKLTVGSADLEVASLFELPLNAPIVKVWRSAVDGDGRLIYLAEGLYRGDTFTLEIDLR